MRISLNRPLAPSPSEEAWRVCAGKRAPVVRLDHIHLQIGGRKLFKDLSLSVAQGERVAIMGMSGSGKSTLLKVIAAIHPPDSGTVKLFGEDVASPATSLNQLRMRIGMVFQQCALISSETVRGNLAYQLEELTSKHASDVDELVREKLATVDMSGTETMMPEELSGGMRRRVAIARALMLDPDLLLLDEPTAGLDPINAHLIDDLIVRLSREMKVTEIFIAHKMESALRVATRVAILHEGRLVIEGTADDLRRSTLPIVAQFLGEKRH